MRSQKQRARQDSEYRRNGKYARVNPCYACGKSAGVDYFSHPLSDSRSPKGAAWNDLALCLCKRCADATQEMQEPDEFREYAAQFGDASEKAWQEVVEQRDGTKAVTVEINPEERDGLLKLDAALAKLARAAWAAHPNNPKKNKKKGAK